MQVERARLVLFLPGPPACGELAGQGRPYFTSRVLEIGGVRVSRPDHFVIPSLGSSLN